MHVSDKNMLQTTNCLIIFLLICLKTCIASDVLFVMLSQPNSYHVQRAEEFRKHFKAQLQDIDDKPDLLLLHEKWPELHSGWAIFPLLKQVASEYGDKSWLVICEDETRVDVKKLVNNLSSYNHEEEIFLGKGLVDEEMVIIHHFNRAEEEDGFTYPDLAAGMAISLNLVKRTVEEFKDIKETSRRVSLNFAIDPKHELAWFLYNKGEGLVMKNVSFLCTNKLDEDCATNYMVTFPECGDATNEEDIFVAVKTCEKNHKERLPIIKELWADQVKNIEIYSETEDTTIPTIDIGVPNTERGHCGKLEAILQRAYKEDYIKSKKWLVITDDDTLLSVPRLLKLLACYNPDEPVALGERYGHALSKAYGYNYITGGGGMVLSMEAVRRIIDCDHCRCGRPDNPDDMMLGMWLKRIDIPVTHSPLFHQARPDDYAKDYLGRQIPVSFHKFWNTYPKEDFQHYLAEKNEHDEL